MKFATKVFAITLGTSVFTATALSLLLYQALKEYQEQQFTESYQSKLKIIGDTLVQLEKSSDLIAQNAAYALQQLEKVQGLPTNESLTELAKSLHVAHIFATDRDGKFIRSTNGDPSQFKNSLFDYCDGYRGLISGVSPLQQVSTKFRTPATCRLHSPLLEMMKSRSWGNRSTKWPNPFRKTKNSDSNSNTLGS